MIAWLAAAALAAPDAVVEASGVPDRVAAAAIGDRPDGMAAGDGVAALWWRDGRVVVHDLGRPDAAPRRLTLGKGELAGVVVWRRGFAYLQREHRDGIPVRTVAWAPLDGGRAVALSSIADALALGLDPVGDRLIVADERGRVTIQRAIPSSGARRPLAEDDGGPDDPAQVVYRGAFAAEVAAAWPGRGVLLAEGDELLVLPMAGDAARGAFGSRGELDADLVVALDGDRLITVDDADEAQVERWSFPDAAVPVPVSLGRTRIPGPALAAVPIGAGVWVVTPGPQHVLEHWPEVTVGVPGDRAPIAASPVYEAGRVGAVAIAWADGRVSVVDLPLQVAAPERPEQAALAAGRWAEAAAAIDTPAAQALAATIRARDLPFGPDPGTARGLALDPGERVATWVEQAWLLHRAPIDRAWEAVAAGGVPDDAIAALAHRDAELRRQAVALAAVAGLTALGASWRRGRRRLHALQRRAVAEHALNPFRRGEGEPPASGGPWDEAAVRRFVAERLPAPFSFGRDVPPTVIETVGTDPGRIERTLEAAAEAMLREGRTHLEFGDVQGAWRRLEHAGWAGFAPEATAEVVRELERRVVAALAEGERLRADIEGLDRRVRPEDITEIPAGRIRRPTRPDEG